jgi:hypothetical protein
MTLKDELIQRIKNQYAEFLKLAFSTRSSKKYRAKGERFSKMLQIIKGHREETMPNLDANLRSMTKVSYQDLMRRCRVENKCLATGYGTYIETYILYQRGVVKLALHLANSYHKNIASLATSSEACAKWGKGGEQAQDWDAYSKGWHSKHGPKKWLNYGVLARIEGREIVVSIYNNRQTLKRTIKVPLGLTKQDVKFSPGVLLDQDLYAVVHPKSGVVTRYDINSKKTGVAIPMPQDFANRFGAFEHGKTVADCRREIAVKRQVIKTDLMCQKHAEIVQKVISNPDTLNIFNDLIVTYNIARAAGLCDQGIRAFCARHRLDVGVGAPVSVLTASNNSYAISAAKKAISLEVAAFLG